MNTTRLRQLTDLTYEFAVAVNTLDADPGETFYQKMVIISNLAILLPKIRAIPSNSN